MQRALIGLIGANIQKSLSPRLHEDAFAATGMRGFYHLIDLDLLPDRKIGEALAAARMLGFTGLNVTFPCKEAVLPLLDEVSPEVRQIGAVNTVTIDARGRTVGHNTDRIGFRRSFEETLGRAAVAVMLGTRSAPQILDAQLVIRDSARRVVRRAPAQPRAP